MAGRHCSTGTWVAQCTADPIITRSIPWTTPHIPEPRCAQWNRRDTHRFRSLMEQSYQTLQTPTCYHDVQSCYQTLVQTTLHAMRTVNSAKPTPQTKPSDVSDWHQVVKQLTRQAKRRSKVFYRRIKHTLLTPPAPSTLPVPSRKIQRILQRNSPWSARAAGLITPQPLLHDPPPPLSGGTARAGKVLQDKVTGTGRGAPIPTGHTTG